MWMILQNGFLKKLKDKEKYNIKHQVIRLYKHMWTWKQKYK